MDYYQILQVAPTASQREIKQAYRYHAQQLRRMPGADPWRAQQIQEAYQVLSNPQRRAAYDAQRGGMGTPAAPWAGGYGAAPYAPAVGPYRQPGLSPMTAMWVLLFVLLGLALLGGGIYWLTTSDSGNSDDDEAAAAQPRLPTSTPSSTQTLMPTATTWRPTPIPTQRPSSTPFPTWTRIPPTPTRWVPTPTPIPQCLSYRGYQVGDWVDVDMVDDTLNLRASPSDSATILDEMPRGTDLYLQGGPYCDNSYVWWYTTYDGQEGWVAEGSRYVGFLAPGFTIDPVPVAVWPPDDRFSVPSNGLLLDGGVGLSTGVRQDDGNVQVEGYCDILGTGSPSVTERDWYCGNRRLSLEDYDNICQLTYGDYTAAAFHVGSGTQYAYRWRCYGER